MPHSLSTRAHRARPAPISQLMARVLQSPNLISLAAGFVDAATLPNHDIQLALSELTADAASRRTLLQYNSTSGHRGLRDALLQRLKDSEPSCASLESDQVILTAGSNQLLHLVSEATVDPGDIVLCSAPTYFVYLGQLEYLGARVIGIECDDEGMLPAALDSLLTELRVTGQRSRIKLLYLVSFCDNPRGVSLSNNRRQSLMDVLSRHDLLDTITVIDDLAYQELHLVDSPAAALESRSEECSNAVRPFSLRHFDPTGGDSTVLAGTFSKSFAPGLRVGWGILPKRLVEPVLKLKGCIDFGSPSLNQHLMHRVLQLGWFDRQVDVLRQTYRIKRQATLDALAASLARIPGVRWTSPTGGLYVWLQLPNELSAGPDSVLLEQSIKRGVMYVPGEYCFPREGVRVQHNTIRLSYGIPSVVEIQTGVAALATAIESALSGVGPTKHK